MSLGPRSTIHFAPESCSRSISATQSMGRTKIDSVISCAIAASMPHLAAQRSTTSTPSASRGVWKPTSTCTAWNSGLKTEPPRSLFLRSASSFSVILLQYSSKRPSCSGVPVMTTERLPLRIDSTGGSTVRTSVENSSSSSAMRSGSTLVTDTIGDLSPRPTMPRRRDTSEPAAPISWSSASSSASLVPLARSDSQAMTPCECPAIATGGVLYRSRPWRVSARMAAIWVSRMPGPEIAAVMSCLVAGSGSSAASARTHCSGSKPMGRTTTSSRATGSSSSAASPTTALSSDSMPAELTSSSRFSSQAPPWPPNATAYGSPAFNRSTRA